MFTFAPLRLGAMEEVTMSTTGLSADATGEGAAQIRFVTKRGSNSFHGNGFEQFRNDVLNANDWFSNAVGAPRQRLRRNEYGGSLGGPLWKKRLNQSLAFSTSLRNCSNEMLRCSHRGRRAASSGTSVLMALCGQGTCCKLPRRVASPAQLIR